MKKKKKIIIPENYLERIPMREESIGWKADEEKIVTLEVENKGWANRLMQLLFFRPKVSYIHLDKFGSFVWHLIDGKTSITEMGRSVEDAFGEEAHPLYERLAQYFRILDSYHLIKWNK